MLSEPKAKSESTQIRKVARSDYKSVGYRRLIFSNNLYYYSLSPYVPGSDN
jgi:hypothetical protein